MSTSHKRESATRLEIFADNEVTARVLNVIDSAEQAIALVSPYIDRVGHVEQAVLKAQQRRVDVLVVVRKDGETVGGRNSGDALEWLKEHKIPVLTVPNLLSLAYDSVSS